MSLPPSVFLDTSIFDAQNYNFSSTALTTFVPVCQKLNMALLLPAPTAQEIERHIRERSLQALAALASARRQAPFLAKWSVFEQIPAPGKVKEWEVHRIAKREWEQFLAQFPVTKLGYELLDVAKVMRWYNRADPPFGKGTKRKEFPDAFAVAMLDAYARKTRTSIAVVSGDGDFLAACKQLEPLLHFPSLPHLTELLLSIDERVPRLKERLGDAVQLLAEQVVEEAIFLILESSQPIEFLAATPESAIIRDASIVAVGLTECTITFAADVSFRCEIAWDEDDEMGSTRVTRQVTDVASVSGTAKLAFDEGTFQINEVRRLSFDQMSVEPNDLRYGFRFG